MPESRIIPFNPLDKKNLGEAVARALVHQKVIPLRELKPFIGAGIYAIYYTGSFPAYEYLSKTNRDKNFPIPIYVGKAVPRGSRKGGLIEAPPGNELYKRISDHIKSINQAINLDLKDFYFRYLIVDEIWIPLGEALLITKLTPLWNLLVEGFGNHDPGKGRHAGVRPRWDVLHPGRPWAARLRERDETAEQIIREIRDFLRNNPPPENLDYF